MSQLRSIVVLTFGLTIGAACASTKGPVNREAACPLTQRDSVFLGGGPVYRDCAVDIKAKRITSPRVEYRPTTPGNNCYAVEFQVVVDTTGKPELGTAQIVRATDRSLADAVISSLQGWRFEPAKLHGAHVRQIAVEKYTIATATVVVPAGQTPSPSMRRPGRAPSC